MTITKRLELLRSAMDSAAIHALIVPSGDFHQSEYVGEHFKALEYVSGFRGSAGTALITRDDAFLWTDGRYFIQAEAELAGSGIRLMRMGVEGVPSLEGWLEANMPKGSRLGFDGRLVSAAQGNGYAQKLENQGIQMEFGQDILGSIWEDRPPLVVEPLFQLGQEFTGETPGQKLGRLVEHMNSLDASHHLIATLDDIAWLTNLRGREFGLSPLFLAFCLIEANEQKARLYIDEVKLLPQIRNNLESQGFQILPYDAIYNDITSLLPQSNLLFDSFSLNYSLAASIPQNVTKTDAPNPSMLLKARKNSVELANIREAHIKDGLAQTKFMYWLKTNVGMLKITELDIGAKLQELRQQQDGFLWESFNSICAYEEHAAMMHYRATPETAKEVFARGLLLTDSGGNYWQGSTDTTRTYSLGRLSEELRLHFTTVLRGMLALSRAKFLKGVRGFNLDSLARAPIWALNIDYKSGTGHGVGYMTTIHEGPCSIRWQLPQPQRIQPPLESGMIMTNEPGIYIEGSHGIRIENELLICEGEDTPHGKFLYFEPLTLSPIDLDAVDPKFLPEEEREYLNWYHQKVYTALAPKMDNNAQREWLKHYTRAI